MDWPVTPKSWLTDETLRRCSPGARGLWLDLVALHCSAGKATTEQDAHAELGVHPLEFVPYFSELVDKGAVAIESEKIKFHVKFPKPVAVIDTKRLEEIYDLYPCHRGKPEALKAIGKAAKELARGTDIDSALAHLKERTAAFAELWKDIPKPLRVPPKLKTPAPWFNQGCYDDPEEQWPRPDRELLSQCKYQQQVQQAQAQRSSADADRERRLSQDRAYADEQRRMLSDLERIPQSDIDAALRRHGKPEHFDWKRRPVMVTQLHAELCGE